jgi:hypothetical protein
MLPPASSLLSGNLELLEDVTALTLDTWFQVSWALALSAILVAIPFIAFHLLEVRMERYGLAEWQLKKLQKDQAAAFIGLIAPNSYQMCRLSLVNQQEKLRLRLADVPSNANWIDGSLKRLKAEIDALDDAGMSASFVFAALPKATGTHSWMLRSPSDSDQLKKARMIREIPEQSQVSFSDGSTNLIKFVDGTLHILDKLEYRHIETMLEERRVRKFLRQFFKFPWNLQMRFPGVQPPEVFFDCILDAWMASLLLMGNSTVYASKSHLRASQIALLEEYVLSLIQPEALFTQKEGNYHHQIAALGHWLALWQEMEALSRIYPGIGLHEMHFNVEPHLRQAEMYQQDLRYLWRGRRTRAICMNWAGSLRPLLAVFEGLS